MVVPNFITMGAAKEEENDGRSESIEMREIEVQVLESDDGASGADGVESLQTSLEHSGASTLRFWNFSSLYIKSIFFVKKRKSG